MLAELRSIRWLALGYFFVLEVLLVLAVLFWPDFEKNVDALRGMAPLQMLKDLVDRIDDEGVVAYVNAQHFFKGCNALGSVAAVLLAMGAVAGEAQRGTLEIWLARPVSRRRLLGARFAAGALAVVVPVFATTATLPWLLEHVHEELEMGPMFLCAAHQSLFLLVVYAAVFLASCVSSSPLRIAFAFLVLAIFEFAIYMVEQATHWSVFRWSDVEVYQRIYAKHALDLHLALPLVALALALFVAAQMAFARRVP